MILDFLEDKTKSATNFRRDCSMDMVLPVKKSHAREQAVDSIGWRDWWNALLVEDTSPQFREVVSGRFDRNLISFTIFLCLWWK
jgi:hypothetical protein